MKIERRRSKIHGNGVFATERIKKGEQIVEYKGKLITHDEADRLHYNDIDTGHTFLFTLNEKWIIDANGRGNIAKWINCSCEPNSVAFVHEHESGDLKKEKVIIEALRNIKPGEEITYDYGFDFDVPYTRKLLKIWECRCGSPNCRGTMLKPKTKASRGTKADRPAKAKKNKAAKKAATKRTGRSKKAAPRPKKGQVPGPGPAAN